MKTRNLIVGKLPLSAFVIDYRTGPSPARLAAAPHSVIMPRVADLFPFINGLAISRA